MQFGNACWSFFTAPIGDLGGCERQSLKLAQPFQAFESGVGDRGASKVQDLELGQPFEMFQSGVGDLGLAE